MASHRQLSLIIPAYNEATVIEQAMNEAHRALSQQFERYEILIVDDGSTDNTAETVERGLQHDSNVRLLRHSTNCGYGAALRSGFEAARYDRIAFTDADCQFDLLDLGQMAAIVDEVPIVVGYRVDRKDPWRRRFLSRGYNRIARMLLGTRVRDVDCALKVFRREALAELLPKSRGFFVNTEMLTRARLLNYEVAEVPVVHRPRAGGVSKVSLTEVPKTLRILFNFWWREVVTGPRFEPIKVWQTRVPVATKPRESGPRPVSVPVHRVAPLARHRESA